MSKLLNLTEVMELTRLSKATIYAYVAARRIPFVKLGSRVMFDEQDIIEWIESKKVDPIGNL